MARRIQSIQVREWDDQADIVIDIRYDAMVGRGPTQQDRDAINRAADATRLVIERVLVDAP